MAAALDNAVWAALSGPLRPFTIGDDAARRLLPDVGAFAAFPDHAAPPWAALARLLDEGGGGMVGIFAPLPLEPPPPLETALRGVAVQFMAPEPLPAPDPRVAALIARLGDADAPEMQALAQETKPGPFFARTHTLGAYFGIRVDGALVAMAGERLRPAGFTEISAVCTRSHCRGRGYAAALVLTVAHHIRARGDVPFLHVAAENSHAIELYRRLGFTERARFHITALRRKAAQ